MQRVVGVKSLMAPQDVRVRRIVLRVMLKWVAIKKQDNVSIQMGNVTQTLEGMVSAVLGQIVRLIHYQR